VQDRLTPDPMNRVLYDDLFATYLDLRESTTGIQHALAARQRW
jgi:hypothetical protein